MSISNNLTKAKLAKYTARDTVSLLSLYCNVCTSLDLNPDDLHIAQDVERLDMEDLYIMSSFLI